MKLIIEDDEGRRTIVPFLGDALNIGRADDNHVRLDEKNVSRKHGRIARVSGRFVVEDLSSFTGIRVNGEKVKGKRQIKEGDLIQISEFDLQLEAGPDDLPKDEVQLEPGPPLKLVGEDDGDGDDEPTLVPGQVRADDVRRNEETAVIKREDVQPSMKAPEATEVPVAERPRLVGANGALRGTEFPLTRSPVSIGRALENDVCLDHPQVSRSHCRLAIVGGGWKVIDAESRHGVKVNGEPYAASPLYHGDVLEVGPVRLLFALPGKPVTLPEEPPPAPPVAPAAVAAEPVASAAAIAQPDDEVAAPHKPGGASKVALVAGAIVIAVAAAVLMFGHGHGTQRETPEAADAALQKAGTFAAAHRYREAVRSVQTALAAGATPEQTRVLPSLETEARAEEQYEQLVQAIARGDFDAARSLLDLLATVPTWFGGRALEHSQEVKAGYVKLHVERANADRGRDDAACLTEANLALSVNPQSDAARALASECGAASTAPGSHARTTTSMNVRSESVSAKSESASEKKSHATASAAHANQQAAARASANAANDAAVAAANEAEARRLLRQGNVEATSGDFTAAISDFEHALSFKSSSAVTGSLYRSLGATHSRAGNAEQGAHYYRLYLPYCDNPTEKAFLQKTLDDYDASRGHKR